MSEEHLRTQSQGIVVCLSQGLVADVPGFYQGLRGFQGNGDGDAARTSADVKDMRAGGEPVQDQATETFRLGARNEHAGGHTERATIEVGLTKHILYGLAGLQPLPYFMQLCFVVCR